jgi:glucosamine-6-phosphate deaminase
MEVIVLPTKEKVIKLATALIDRELRRNLRLVLGLATGRTMEALYAELVNMHKEEALDFSLCQTFNLDEYIGLSKNDSHSYHYYMQHHLFSHINIDQRNVHIPNGLAPNLEEECYRYEYEIKKAGGIDLQLLGIGEDGHIGFNEPLSALLSRTRVKALSPTTIAQNAPLFGSKEAVPKRVITMGVGTILESKRCVLVATGKHKARIIARAVEGPITSMISATALQLHAHCSVIVDEEAAKTLENKDYYLWVFNNEPEWEPFRKILND